MSRPDKPADTSTGARDLLPTDAELLERAYRQVIPLKGHARVRHEALKPHRHLSENLLRRRSQATRVAAEPSGLSDGIPDDTAHALESYRASGVAGEALRRLRRESEKIHESLDLHGLNRDQARVLIHDFVARARDRGISRVRIIHGQGYGSSDGSSVLKYLTRHWLAQMPEVIAFVTPAPNQGGKGAVLVLLRAS